MSLYKKWEELTQKHDDKSNEKILEAYFKKEAEVYEEILENGEFEINTTVSQFAKKYDMDLDWVIGFVDGINTSLKEQVDVNELEENSKLMFEILPEKLFYNMHVAGANWLYGLPQWDDLLSEQKKLEIEREYKATKTVVVDERVGRNEPCVCGSGKKYKKCCLN